MTENKRFTTLRMKNLIANEMGNYIQDNGTTILKLGFFEDCNDVCEVLNELSEENRQLREEIKDFQDLLSKGDNVCYERVLGLIDEKIK